MLCCAPHCWQRNASNYGGVTLCPTHFEAVAECVPPPEPQPVVYYVERADRPGQVKIGTTKSLRARLNALGARGRTVTLLATEPGGRPLEKARHQQFAEMRIELEWFALGSPIVDHIRHLNEAA